MRVLSIDPALRKTGFAVIERNDDESYRALTYGIIRNPPGILQSACLVNIRRALNEVIIKHKPEVCAVESVIYVQSYKTAITMGAARAAAVIAAADHDLPVFEYAPKRVKQAIVGKGAADKRQVAFMIRSILRLEEDPSPDAADALAVGMAHLYSGERINKLTGKQSNRL